MQQVFWRMEVAENIDLTIYKCVNQLATSCPALKTQTIHIVSFAAFVHLTLLAARNICKTTKALALLKDSLDQLTIIGMPAKGGARGVFCPRDEMSTVFDSSVRADSSEYALLNAIAPWSQWQADTRSRRQLNTRSVFQGPASTTMMPKCFKRWPEITVCERFVSRDVWAMEKEAFRLFEHMQDIRAVGSQKFMYAEEPQI